MQVRRVIKVSGEGDVKRRVKGIKEADREQDLWLQKMKKQTKNFLKSKESKSKTKEMRTSKKGDSNNKEKGNQRKAN